MFDNDEEVFGTEGTLNIDGDILVYKPCCVFNEDTEDVTREAITKVIMLQINAMLRESGCTKYRVFMSPKSNFRHHIVDDYKANRKDVVRPLNLVWAKEWATTHLEAVAIAGLEADDLLAIYQTDDTVLWSPDKDLRQVPGRHLDDTTRQIIHITEVGLLKDLGGGKVYFTGYVGLYYQMLVGDSADYIVGCGRRVPKVYKSGKRKGQAYVSRSGIGPKKAVEIITKAVFMSASNPDFDADHCCKMAVLEQYRLMFGEMYAKHHMEIQGNLLFMVRKYDLGSGLIRRWTVDGREEWMCLKTGGVYGPDTEEGDPPLQETSSSKTAV